MKSPSARQGSAALLVGDDDGSELHASLSALSPAARCSPLKRAKITSRPAGLDATPPFHHVTLYYDAARASYDAATA